MGAGEIISNPWFIGISTTILGSGLVALIGRWRGWWRNKKPASIDLATRVLTFLEGDAEENTRKMIFDTKKLGDSLLASINTNVAHDHDIQYRALDYIHSIVEPLKRLVSELTAADEELDYLKRAVMVFQMSLEDRSQTVTHLCNPPNPPAMDASHVRTQLLSVNTKPNDYLQAAKGEAVIFLRGYGIGRRARFRYFKQTVKKHWPAFKESVAKEHRTTLQQTSLHKARK